MAKRHNLCESPVVISIDPGGTTGWSIMQVHPESLILSDVPILANIEHWTSGQFEGDENQQARDLGELIAGWPGSCVVIEAFIIRQFNQSADFLSPVRITAKLEYILWNSGGWSVFKQQPAEAKSVAPDVRLKSWGFYRSEGAQRHARDADRHNITWLRKCKERPELRGMSWPHLYGKGMEFGIRS